MAKTLASWLDANTAKVAVRPAEVVAVAAQGATVTFDGHTPVDQVAYLASAPPHPGDTVQVLSTGRQYLILGTSSGPSAYQPVEIRAGYGIQGDMAPCYKIDRDRVYLDGAFAKTTGSLSPGENDLGSVPLDGRPVTNAQMPAAANYTGTGAPVVRVVVRADDGTIQAWTQRSDVTWVSLSGLSYRLR